MITVKEMREAATWHASCLLIDSVSKEAFDWWMYSAPDKLVDASRHAIAEARKGNPLAKEIVDHYTAAHVKARLTE